MPNYLFGDGDVAARRLEALSDVFAESSKAFLQSSVDHKPVLTVDLGCGPGYTTQFLSSFLQSDRTVGLDNSENFLALARKLKLDGVEFYCHDVTTLPFPVGPADLLFCRYLLSHLKYPLAVISGWATQLRPNGLLLMEETEWMQTDNQVFSKYIGVVEALLLSQSNKLCVGSDLELLADSGTLKKRANEIRRLPVQNSRAATMFYLNLQSWKTQPFVLSNYRVDMIAGIEEGLYDLIQADDKEAEIEWGLRQVVLEKV